ncbi:MAG: hypothetical protein QOJ96_1428 [Alphaproteobacteria bacterium]|jgi:hypothetical protein|nr:hypothetical protein [Alphaproteobacteria bacterium]
MPRLVKSLPENRAACSFGDLVYWHLFVHGTRPDTDPSAKIGRVWDLKRASGALGISERALRYWINDKHLPDSTTAIERVIFGNSPAFDDWRLELVEALRKTRLANAGKAAGSNLGVPPVTGGPLVRLDTGAIVTGDEDLEEEQSPFEIVPVQHVFKDEPKRNSRGQIVKPAPEILYATRKPKTAQAPRRTKTAAVAVVGVTTLLGLYAWASNRPTPKETRVVWEIGKTDEKPAPVTLPPASKGAQQATGPSPAEKVQREAEDRAEAQRQAQLKATRDAVESRKNEQEASARALNEKLKILAQADGDQCKQKLEGLSIPGFTLKCDTLIPFGKMLGAVPVSQTASSLGDCAARCRRVKDCVAFSFDAGAHVGAASCYLTGSIPGYNNATNWISGTR